MINLCQIKHKHFEHLPQTKENQNTNLPWRKKRRIQTMFAIIRFVLKWRALQILNLNIARQSRANVIKHFTAVIYKSSELARVFVPGKFFPV